VENLMSVAFKPNETFRDDFSFRNSPVAIRRFPFPFHEDYYMYSVNIEPHAKAPREPENELTQIHSGTFALHTRGPKGSVVEFPIDIDEHYLAECEDRRLVLEEDPQRFQALPHMMSAQWDTLELIMESLSRDYPEHFSLTRKDTRWTWENRPLHISQQFIFGDPSTLPYQPLEYITRQAQGDWVLMDQRDNDLYMDAGMVTTQADWSLDFDLGMSFMEWHGPVPLAHEMGIFERALKYLGNLQINEPIRRLNWTMTIHPWLDTSPEKYHLWGSDRAKVTADNVGEVAHLRVELQAMWRLPRSNAVVFSVRAYLISMNELVTIPKWAKRMHRVLKTLHPALVDYKGLSRYRDTVVQWLSKYDDGAELTPGTAPD
jgi:dimethylamine monooxygenase subunit A